MKRLILVLNGPNLNLLGTREPEVYGSTTLSHIEKNVLARSKKLNISVDFRQSNNEGELIDWIHSARGEVSGIIMNAGAYTHTSVALLDALLASQLPVVEVHLTNTQNREAFRHHSYIASASIGMICGFGGFSYELALDALHRYLDTK